MSKLQQAILEYSSNGYIAQYFADAVCQCSSRLFKVKLDDTEGVAVRICATCDSRHPIGDSAEYLANAKLDEATCPCGKDEFEVAVGVSLYDNSEDVRWLYLGCRCPSCGLSAVYGDWKNEFNGYQELLALV